jgi:hypothetical protein
MTQRQGSFSMTGEESADVLATLQKISEATKIAIAKQAHMQKVTEEVRIEGLTALDKADPRGRQ